MAKHNALGKGLGALLDESGVQQQPVNAEAGTAQVKVKAELPAGITADENGTLWVDPNLLKPNPHQPRKYFDEAKLEELTESVRKEGVLSPIIIEDAGDGFFYIIAGERRTRASRAAGLSKVPVQLRKYSDIRKLEVALIENIQRDDLNPIEEAQAYMGLMSLNEMTQEQVAERVGKKRATVANSLRLLKLPEDIQRALVEDKISSGHAKVLLSLESETDKRILYAKIMGQGLSVRQCEEEVKIMKSGKSSPSTPAAKPVDRRDPNFIDIETKFIEAFGTKVQLKGNFDKGQIVINYYSAKDLDRLYNIIMKQ